MEERDGLIIIENMLLSCRVFSRGIETACLAAVLGYAKASGARKVVGRYRETARNRRFADLFERHGFCHAREEAGCRESEHQLADPPTPASHIVLTADFRRQRRC